MIGVSNITSVPCKKRKPCPYAQMTKTSNLILKLYERKRKHLYNERQPKWLTKTWGDVQERKMAFITYT
jgi:hypothetical protein